MKNGLIIDKDGIKRHFLNGKLHCEHGPAVEYPDGIKYWYLNNVMQSEELADGSRFYRCSTGDLHRINGPAIQLADGRQRWFFYGEHMTEEEHAAAVAKM